MRLLPNFLTSLRILAAPLVAYLVIQEKFVYAWAVVLFAALTDWFDGWTARKLQVGGKTGVILDPAADKIMLVTLFVAMTIAGLVPVWLLGVILGRDVVIVAGSLLLRVFREVRTFTPSVMGKVSTFFQIIYLLLTLLYAVVPLVLLDWLTFTALVLTTFFTLWSGLGYVLLGIRLTRRLPA